MERHSLFQSFAIAKNGDLVSVNEVERGLACNCTCPSCGEALLAKQGNVRVWHFSHASETECKGAAESALHLAAKRIIEKTKGLMLPGMTVSQTYRLPDGRQITEEASIPDMWIDFEEVTVEEQVDSIRPDVIGLVGGRRYLIEIAVTHFVEDDKRKIIQAIGDPAIEIVLDPSAQETWDWQSLELAVVQGTHLKDWLYHPGKIDLEAEALAKAAEAALRLAPLPAVGPSKVAKRIRYKIRGRILDVIDYPFGVGVWSPYDPEVNTIIKGLARRLGGQYQPRYKNWLFPSPSRPWLEREISAAADGPPTIVS